MSPPRKHTNILLVDDDPELRTALRRELGISGYRCHEAADAAEAMEVLQTVDIAAVVSDFDMPGVNGLDLLQRVRICHPETFRVLLTGGTDVHIAARALNEGAAHRFLLKPWDRVDLRGILEVGLHARRDAARGGK